MAREETFEVQAPEAARNGALEQTRSGPVYTPAVDIFESADSITILADMPGVRRKDLRIDLHEGILAMTGEVTAPKGEGESEVFSEFTAGRFHRQFALSDKIDQNRIDARLTEGVLRLKLPKAEASKPRQIEVKAG